MSTAPATNQQPDQNDPEHQTYTDAENKASRKRSFALLGELISPVKGQFVLMAIMVVIAQLAVVAGPAIIAWGIDHGLPSLMAGDPVPAYQAAGLAVGAAIIGGVLTYGYVRQSVVVGQRMLLALRRKVFRFTQKQDLEFHESYTSGRIVSRQTSDMEALRELLDSGVNVMVGASLSMVFTIVLIVTMDPVTGLVMLLMLIPCVMLTVWFQKRSRIEYRAIRTHSARLIVHFVEAMAGMDLGAATVDTDFPEGHGGVHQSDEALDIDGFMLAIRLLTHMVLACDEKLHA